jgi:hypothetical protein
MSQKLSQDESKIKLNEELSWLNGSLKHRALDEKGRYSESVGYYPNGQLMFQYPSTNNQMNGACRIWYENGQVQQEENYLEGRLHGVRRTWDQNGVLRSRVEYRQGLRHGSEMLWSSDKELVVYNKYAANRLHGVCVTRDHSNQEVRRVYVQGRMVTDQVEHAILTGTLTAQFILKLRNAAVRRLCLEELGYARFLSHVEHEVISKDGEQELVRINWLEQEEPICLVKVRCPSTGAYYALRVPPTMTTVKGAVAWTFGLSEQDYRPVAET